MSARNPFWFKDAVVWQRENPACSLRGTRLAVVGAMLAPVLLVLFLSSCFPRPGDVLLSAWALSSLTWLGVVSMLAVNAGLHVYTRERDLGALEISALTPTTPWREVCGRCRGAFIPVGEAWMLGFVYVATALLLEADGIATLAVSLWTVSLLWFYALTAVSLHGSARSRTSNEALGGVIASLLLLNATYLVVSAMFELRYETMRSLPLNPLAFLHVGEWAVSHRLGSDSYVPEVDVSVLLLVYLPLWIAFVCAVLLATARLVTRGVPLRMRAASQAPSGIVPVTAAGCPGAGVRPTPPLAHGLPDRLLKPFDGNPFYHAYRKGFMRVYSGVNAAPGSALPPALVLVGLVVYRMLAFGGESEITVGTAVLVAGVLLASLIGLCEGLALGARALSSERDRDTWSMLVVSGMTPQALLRGKFATSFYALSGEWSLATPLWLLAALWPHPVVLLLAVVQPASIALGILVGLWMASQPRYLVVSIPHVLLAGGAIVAGIFLLKRAEALLIGLAPMLDPVAMSVDLAFRDALAGVSRFVLQAGLMAAAAAVLWHLAARRLERVLRGE